MHRRLAGHGPIPALPGRLTGLIGRNLACPGWGGPRTPLPCPTPLGAPYG